MATETKSKEEPKTLTDRLAERAVKRMEKNVDKGVDQKLEQGKTPSEILTSLLSTIGGGNQQNQSQRINSDLIPQINQIAQQRIGVPGRENVLSRILTAGTTNDPMQLFGSKTAPIGFDNATKLLQLQQSLDKNAMEGPKNQTMVIKNLIDIAKNTGNKELFAALSGMQMPQTAIEVDPMTGNPTEKGIRQKARAERMESSSFVDDMKNIDTQINNIEAIGTLLEGEPAGIVFGELAKMGGKMTRGATNLSGELARQFSPAIAAGVYKTLTNDRQISNSDAAERSKPLVPQQGEDPRLQKIKVDFIREMFVLQKQSLQNGGTGSLNMKELVTGLKNKIEFEKKKMGNQQTSSKDLPPELQKFADQGFKVTRLK